MISSKRVARKQGKGKNTPWWLTQSVGFQYKWSGRARFGTFTPLFCRHALPMKVWQRPTRFGLHHPCSRAAAEHRWLTFAWSRYPKQSIKGPRDGTYLWERRNNCLWFYRPFSYHSELKSSTWITKGGVDPSYRAYIMGSYPILILPSCSSHGQRPTYSY